MNKSDIINEIKPFLEGRNNNIKYLVNVEADPRTNIAKCIIQHPEKGLIIEEHKYTPFLFIKDIKKLGINLYNGDDNLKRQKIKKYGLKFTILETGKQKRLEDGYKIKVESDVSYYSITNFFKEGGLDIYEPEKDANGRLVRDHKGDKIFPNRHIFFGPKPHEQFLISTGSRLFKGFEEYSDIHRFTFDIETTGLRYKISRILQIGIRNNKGFEEILEVDKPNDDESEKALILKFFQKIQEIKPSVILGYNSEDFDFEFIIGRCNELKLDINNINTSLDPKYKIKRLPDRTVKFGNESEKYTATEMWGFSIIDIYHAVKKTAALNTEIKKTSLKEICKYEDIAKENRTYINGSEGKISKYWLEDKRFIINPNNNNYIEIPDKYQQAALILYNNQENLKNEIISEFKYDFTKKKVIENNKDFIKWLVKKGKKLDKYKFIGGRDIVRNYLLDDLWETEQVDELYNQSAFLLAKIVPTTFARVSTMGTAAVWNLLLTTWSYENNLAIPITDKKERFSGGLARCFKRGYTKRLVKIDFASLYPMIQLSEDIFPIFDINGVIKKMLIYLTTTRNIYKKLASGDELNKEEQELLVSSGYADVLEKYKNGSLTKKERSSFKIKQLPIKILNNSLFGALGSGFAFNWSDNICAARITCSGRIHLRHVTAFFKKFDCVPLYAVTDGVNFGIPDKTTIKLTDGKVERNCQEAPNEEMWKYGDKTGISALIEMFNKDISPFPDYITVDNDGEFVSCLNLKRINYASLEKKVDKKTGEINYKIKLTGNSMKSKTIPEYVEEFYDEGLKKILHGDGVGFVEYYNEYVERLFNKKIPLKKIASKNRIKNSIEDYLNRGTDKNGRQKSKQAHMEHLIRERDQIAINIFKEKFSDLMAKNNKTIKDYSMKQIYKIVSDHMPPERPLDSTIYVVNTGYRKSHGDSSIVKDPINKEEKFGSKLISATDLDENPDMLGEYNVDRYLANFNKKVKALLVGFEEDIAKEILINIKNKKVKDENGNKKEIKELVKNEIDENKLILKNFELDNYAEAMILEDDEIEFWNKFGYDPRKLWKGFRVPEDHIIHYDIYENALNHVREEVKKSGKNLKIKSINDRELEKGDYILIRYFTYYSMGRFNGKYIEIVREKVNIPKTELDYELEKKYTKENKKKREEDKQKNKIFEQFKKEHQIPIEATMSDVFAQIENSEQAFNDYFSKKLLELKNEQAEYLGIDDEIY